MAACACVHRSGQTSAGSSPTSSWKPGPRRAPQRAGGELLAAVVAGEHALADVAAGGVLHDDRRVVLAEDPLVAPLADGRHHREQGAALVGEAVVVATAGLVVGDAGEHVVVDERVEPGGEHVASDAEALGEVVEAGDAEEGVAQDQQRPPLADHLERLGHRAVHVGERDLLHTRHPTILGCVMQRYDAKVGRMTQPSDAAVEAAPRIPWPVFFVTVAGAFVVALDLSIVNVAFPSIKASFPEVVDDVALVGAVGLQRGVRRPAARRRSHRRPLRPAALVPPRHRRVHARLAAVRRRHQPRGCSSAAGSCRPSAPRCSCRPRSRCCSAPPPPSLRAQAVAMWGGISALAVATGPSLGRGAHRRRRLAVGLLHQPARARSSSPW